MSPSLPPSIPQSNIFLTSLISTLTPSPSLPSSPTTNNDAIPLSQAAKPTLLTLHALFPTLLLPALDLLDRGLVTRFILQEEEPPTDRSNDVGEGTNGDGDGGGKSQSQSQSKRMIYYVQSNAHRDGRSRYTIGRSGGDGGGTSYEVRTGAWSCTCHAFAYSAFNNAGGGGATMGYGAFECAGDFGNGEENEEMLDVVEPEREEGDGGWRWGGMMLGEEDVPLCKHLLACVLVERWRGVEERVVGREEMAGWAAGWGG